MQKRITPVWIMSLKPNEVFVFGSNLAGIHGKGAASQAVKWGAKYGTGYGLSGQTFAIPTKDKKIITLDLKTIDVYVEGFLIVARRRTDLNFLITEVGCGLAAYRPEQIAPMFLGAMSLQNCFLPEKFLTVLNA